MRAPIAIIMGSQSDWETMRHAADLLDELGVACEKLIVSAHRTPERLFAFAKGSISPETIGVGRSIDGLVMVLLGGIQTLTGPVIGASVYATLQDTVMRQTDYWRALLGGIILVLVLAFPQGIAGGFTALWQKTGART